MKLKQRLIFNNGLLSLQPLISSGEFTFKLTNKQLIKLSNHVLYSPRPIKDIKMHRCVFPQYSFHVFIKDLLNCRDLESINFTQCKKINIAAIASELKTNTTLKSLLFRNNRCGKQSANQLAEAISQNNTLEYLDLSLCDFGEKEEGSQIIVAALKNNRSLKTVKFEGIIGTKQDFTAIVAAAQANPNLTCVEFEGLILGRIDSTDNNTSDYIASMNAAKRQQLLMADRALKANQFRAQAGYYSDSYTNANGKRSLAVTLTRLSSILKPPVTFDKNSENVPFITNIKHLQPSAKRARYS